MLLYTIWTVTVLVDVATEPYLKLCLCMGIVYFCENSHLLIHTSEHACMSAIYYQMDSLTYILYCTAKHAIHLKSDPTILDAAGLLRILDLLKPRILVVC